MWMPTRRMIGEGRADGESLARDSALSYNHRFRSGHRGSEHSMPGRQFEIEGEARDQRGVAYPERSRKGRRLVWASERAMVCAEQRVAQGG